MINPVFLTQMLVRCLCDTFAGGGWDQPDYVFAVRGRELDLEYLMQVPGPIADFLPTLLELGLEVGPGVLGLVLVTRARERRTCSAMGMLRDGTMRIVSLRGGGVVQMLDRLPEVHGAHCEVVQMLSRLVGAPVPPTLAAVS